VSLRARAASGVFWNMVGSGGLAVLQLGQLSLLARLLEKADFGLMAIVGVVASFARGWLDLGLGNAIVHRQGLAREQLNTFFWLGAGTGLVIFLGVAAGAPLLAAWYKEPELARLVLPVAATFILFPLGNQYQLLLQKELRFRAIALVELTAKVIAVAVTALLAVRGLGPWAIAYGIAASETARAALMMAAGSGIHRPGLQFRWASVREFTSFGLFQLGERAINTLLYEIDVLIIGKLVGKEGLGIYSYAKQLVTAPSQMFIPIITRVSFPTLARLQADVPRLRAVFLRSLRTLVMVLFPVHALLIVLADEVVLICFGRDWGPTLLVVQILALYAALRAVASPVGSLAIACGGARMMFFWNLAQLVLVPAVMLVAGTRGLTGVAWGWVGLYAALMVPSWWFLVRPLCGASFREYFGLFVLPVAVSALVVVAGLAVQPFAAGHIGRVILVGSVCGGIIAAANLWANRDLLDLLRPRPAASAAGPDAPGKA
jgi:O-antigen/teichoic acid export membrane protein